MLLPPPSPPCAGPATAAAAASVSIFCCMPPVGLLSCCCRRLYRHLLLVPPPLLLLLPPPSPAIACSLRPLSLRFVFHKIQKECYSVLIRVRCLKMSFFDSCCCCCWGAGQLHRLHRHKHNNRSREVQRVQAHLRTGPPYPLSSLSQHRWVHQPQLRAQSFYALCERYAHLHEDKNNNRM